MCPACLFRHENNEHLEPVKVQDSLWVWFEKHCTPLQLLLDNMSLCVCSTLLRRQQQSMFTVSDGRLVSEKEEAVSSSSLPLSLPSSPSWPITTSGLLIDSHDSQSPSDSVNIHVEHHVSYHRVVQVYILCSTILMYYFLVLTLGAGLVVFQPIRDEATGHPVQSHDGRHLQGAGQIPQQGKTPSCSHLGFSERGLSEGIGGFDQVPVLCESIPGLFKRFSQRCLVPRLVLGTFLISGCIQSFSASLWFH